MRILPCLTLLCFILSACGTDRTNINYIHRITGIRLPYDVKIISEVDNGEWISVGKYRLPEKEITDFMKDKPFKPMDDNFIRLSSYNHLDSVNKIEVGDGSHLKFLSGCSLSNLWLFTINDSTGDLWVEVQYPDQGGMSPGCDSTEIKPTTIIRKLDTSMYAVITYDPKNIFMRVVDGGRKCRPAKLNSKEVDAMESYIIGALNERAKDTNMLQPHELSTYRRQYVAYYNNKGQKEVWVNFFCDEREYWRDVIIIISDGGPCFFNLTINLATRAIYSVSVNGYA